jgi:hypothetical protein
MQVLCDTPQDQGKCGARQNNTVRPMKTITATLVSCLICLSLGHADPQEENDTSLKGKDLVAFLEKYVEVEINDINKGHSISMRIPNPEDSDRQFFSIQLFLVSPHAASEEVDVDVFEVTSRRNGGDIDFLMNISDEKLQASYVVLREQRDDNPRKETEWVRTTIRLEDLLAENLPKGEGGTGQPATRPVFEPEGSDKPQPESEGRSR